MKNDTPLDLPRRMRRLRKSGAIRALVQETRVSVDDLIAPLFVKESLDRPEPVDSMPGVFRYSLIDLLKHCQELKLIGIKAVAIFPCLPMSIKDSEGSEGLDPDGLILQAIRLIKKEIPELLVITDVALDPYTDHGHDGVFNEDGTVVDNDATVDILCRMAVLQAEAGVDLVAPSDMMDGRILAIRDALDEADMTATGILAYSAKFNSAYYGPFRDAVGSKKAAGKVYLDKSTYQLNPANRREASMETMLDEEEGADILMVKPAGAYLDIISDLSAQTDLPVAAYQVSGEYSQIHAAAKLGWLELEKVRDESLLAIKRAGAHLILTYFAEEVARKLNLK